MLEKTKKIILLLSLEEKKQFILLVFLSILVAFIDVLGVASILPFITVLTNPEIVNSNEILYRLFNLSQKFGIESNDEFLFILGLLVFFVIVISLTLRSITTYIQIKFGEMRQYSIGKRLFNVYLGYPYTWFLNQNSSELGKNILSEVGQVISHGINPLIEFISKSILAITIICLLIIVDVKFALIVGCTLSGSYALIYFFLRRFIGKIGKNLLNSNRMRFIHTSEAFGAIKSIKLAGIENKYVNKFATYAKEFADTHSYSQIISQIPRFFLEIIAIGGVMISILYLIGLKGTFNSALPIISLYIFAGYRLMPALQQIFASLTQLKFVDASLNNLISNFKNTDMMNLVNHQKTITFDKSIRLNNVYYNYPNTSEPILKNISLNIPAYTSFGIIGSTGSGKTTTVDLILGLLMPKKGTLEVDGEIITKINLKSWQKLIGYVPQQIYLSDDTIAANIAFGLESKEINFDIIEQVSKIANLHDFVKNELPNKYQTIVGERGIRLSGGQKQRIAIARALYFNPKVLILDEATSALDNKTERTIIEALNNLNRKITIIIIAHRLETIKYCDNVIKIDKGIIAS